MVFFRALDPDEQRRFRRELQVFLSEKRLTGIGTEVDTTTLVLAGASAIIPIFGFPEWEWDQISEVFPIPSRLFHDSTDAGRAEDRPQLALSLWQRTEVQEVLLAQDAGVVTAARFPPR